MSIPTQVSAVSNSEFVLTTERKNIIIDTLWPESGRHSVQFDKAAHEEFFQYIQFATNRLKAHHTQFAYQGICANVELVNLWRQHETDVLTVVIDIVANQFINNDANLKQSIQRSLELSVRIWLGLNVETPSIAMGAPVVPYEFPARWQYGQSLQQLVEAQFKPGSTLRTMKGTVTIDGNFTAAYLSNICGLKIHWTDYITDHLRLDKQGNVLTVYKHKICITNHLRNPKHCPISEDVLLEAIDTLNLLFPFGDIATREFLIKEGRYEFYRLGNCGRDRELSLSRYRVWREGLESLLDSYNRPPRTWRQLATDRRNLMEWSAFWVTAMVAFLTLVMIPCNIIQAMYSVKSYYAALAQNAQCT